MSNLNRGNMILFFVNLVVINEILDNIYLIKYTNVIIALDKFSAGLHEGTITTLARFL